MTLSLLTTPRGYQVDWHQCTEFNSCFLFDCFKVKINTWSSTYKTHGNFMFLKFFFIFSLLIIECYKMITRSRVSIPVKWERSTIWAARASWNAVYQSWPTTPVSFKIELLCKSKNHIWRAVWGIFSTCLRGRFKHDWLSPVRTSPAVTNFPRSSTRFEIWFLQKIINYN